MILKPSMISPNNISKDATSNITISWRNTGDRQYFYRITIFDNSNNELEYDSTKISSLNTFHIIPENTLTNGITHKYQIQVWNQNDETALSDWIIFKTSSIPQLQFTNISESSEILNNSYLFLGEYTQAENIPIRSWTMILYNSADAIIGISPETFDNNIEYSFAGLNNDSNYSVELQAKSQDNLIATTGKIHFTVRYEVPQAFISLNAENVNEKAAIRLQWNVSQIIGESENSFFIDNEKLDTTNGGVWFDDGFNIRDNFTLKLWVESIDNPTFILNLNSSVVSYNVEPTDTTVLWLDNSSQTTELPLNIVVGNIQPETNTIWIEDYSQVPRQLGVSMTFEEPDQNHLWIDLGSDSMNKYEILKMKNSLNENISIQYYNSAFHIYKNSILLDSVEVNGSEYYLYIQQINNNITIHAEVLA